MSESSSDYDRASQLRHRLWGAAVLIAIAVIVLPLILDGAGSESQFRQVERLREEPVASARPVVDDKPAAAGEKPVVEAVVKVSEKSATEPDIQAAKASSTRSAALTAWVVQAAALSAEPDAIALRDKLRQAGFASFVRDREDNSGPYRVLVGPMIKQQSAEKARASVAELLQSDPIVVSYP